MDLGARKFSDKVRVDQIQGRVGRVELLDTFFNYVCEHIHHLHLLLSILKKMQV
jgi:hypothetical protein